MPRSIEGLAAAPEWAALRALLPELRGLKVLDLGCGFALPHLDEWAPTEEQIAAQPLWADERQRPPFLLVACDRTKAWRQAPYNRLGAR